MNRRSLLLAGVGLPMLGRGIADAQNPVAPAPTGRIPLLIEGKQSLFQRVITRPDSMLSPGPDGIGGKPVPGFSVFYVYARLGGDSGGVQVGRTADGGAEGWLPAAKVIDWKHTMVGAFANPANRGRVIFLRTERDARLVMLSARSGDDAQVMRRAALSGQDPGPVVALEPETFVDISRNFYLLPILRADLIEREVGPPLRLLEVLSAPAEAPAKVPPRKDPLQDYKAAVVFVIDTTLSMQPYIERTRNAAKAIVARIGASPVRDKFRFGLIAYRDSLDDNPGLEYATRLYAKPDFSQPLDAINSAIADVHESPASSTSFDEDPLGGLKSAFDEIGWDDFAGKYIILITDAGARPSTHPRSLTHLDIPDIHQLAAGKGIAMFAIHLLTPEGRKRHDHDPARAQYSELTRFGGAGPLYYPVAEGAPEAFATTVEALSTALLQDVANTVGQPVAGLAPKRGAADKVAAVDPRMQEQVRMVGTAMRLAYLGRVEGTQAPDVVRSFTTDRDFADSNITSLDVRVLLTRNQLSDLAQALQRILDAGLAGRTEPRTFFKQLRSTFAVAARDPARLAGVERISSYLGEYVDGLPYRSEVMDITEPDWLAMGAIAQRTVLNDVEARLILYRDLQTQRDLWVDLSGTRSPGEALYPLPLEALP